MEEAQRNMPYKEYISWVKYATKHGTLNHGKRVEKSIAYVALNFASAYLKKKSGQPFDIDDFLLYETKPQKGVGSPEEVYQMLATLAPKET